MRALTFTTYPTARTTTGQPSSKTWESWCEIFAARAVRESKDGPSVVLGEIAKEKRRAKANVRAAHAIGIDLEKLTQEVVAQVFDALDPYEYFMWTTHSHTEKNIRLRIVLPFAEAIEPSDYAAVWSGLNLLIGKTNDPQTKDISRLHYLPSHPPGAEGATSWKHGGQWISAGDLPDTTNSSFDAVTQEVTSDDPVVVRRLVESARAKLRVVHKDDPLKPLAKALLDGEDLGGPGKRHNAIRSLTWWLAEKIKNIPTAALNELFSTSLHSIRKQNPDDPQTLEQVVSAYQGAQTKILESEQQYAEKKEAERRKKAQEFQVKSSGSDSAYTPDDLKRIAALHDWEPGQLRDKWIIQREGMHWMIDASGAYRGPYLKEDVSIAVTKILARAPVRLTETTRNGVSYRPFSDVVRESGQVAERVVSDMTLQHTRFDTTSLTLYEAILPLRKLTPAFHPEIDEWLKLLAGPQYSRLVDWLSCVSDLNKLLCAVYLDGPKGAGKTLLPTGLARLWTEGPPGDLELVLSDFNDEISRCPLLLADEEMPRPYRSTTVTTKLRSMLSTLQRTLKRKFKPPTELMGAVRLMLAANNEFLLDSKDVSSAQDLDAIAQRFLYINVPQEASDYLNELPRKTRGFWANQGIAEHALWLRDNHEVEAPGKRFWVEGDVSQMHRLLMTGSRWNSLVCEWLTRYLMQPELFDNKNTGHVRTGKGELMVNDQGVIDGWELYMKNTKAEPETNKIGAALRALASTQHRPSLRFKGKRIRYRIIDIDHVLAWSDRHNIGDREEMLGRVNGEAVDKQPPGVVDDFGTLPGVNEGTPF